MVIIKNACPVCGGDLMANYKGRHNSYKCFKCHRWIVGRLSTFGKSNKGGARYA